MTKRIAELLLVEDNPADVLLTRKAFSEVANKTSVHSVGNGKQALGFLEKRGKYNDAPDPDLILLDLNLPGISGHELLTMIRENKSLKYIPIIILSSSSNRDDVSAAYEYGANSYVRKPHDWDEFKQVVQAIETFWLKTVRVPETM